MLHLHLRLRFELMQAFRHLMNCHMRIIRREKSSALIFVVADACFVPKGLGEQFSIVEVHAPGKNSVAQIDSLHQDVVLQLSSVDILSRAIGGLTLGPHSTCDIAARRKPNISSYQSSPCQSGGFPSYFSGQLRAKIPRESPQTRVSYMVE